MRRRSSLAFTLALLGAACTEERDPRPNVLLISLDSVRRDMLGCYGASFGGRSPSPNLDRLAAEGVRIEDALSSTSWTLPAHATLFTGMPELAHGLEQDGQRLAESLPTLAERLRASGYRTAGVYSGPYLDPRFGLGRGFESYRAGYGPELASATEAAAEARARVHGLGDSTPRDQSYDVLERNAEIERALEMASHSDSSSRSVTELVLEELAATADDARPFLLFAHYFDPHFDYVPPPPFGRDFDPTYDGQMDGRDFPARIAAPSAAPRDLEHLRALHAGELAWTDSEIGRVLEELEHRGLAANTLVVVISDHGDEFLEHGGFGHRRTLYQEVVRVPVILRWPRRLPTGETRPGPSSLAAVAPTILALLSGDTGRAPLLALAPDEQVLGRLILNPTGRREDVRVLESFHFAEIKLLRERCLSPTTPETLRWIDLARHPAEHEADWSSDFTPPPARAALAAFQAEYERLMRLRHEAPLAEQAGDLLAAFRGLGYAGEEARVGALPDAELVRPPPAGR